MPEVWPFVPLASMRERLSFLTDVRRAAASEARTSLRAARLVLDFEHLLDDAQNAWATELFAANAAGRWWVPHWGEATELGAVVPAGATFLPAHPFAGWAVGGMAAVTGGDWRDPIEVIEIAAVDGTGITLAAPTSAPCAMVMPALSCIATSGLSGARWWRGMSRRMISFMAVDAGAPPAPTYPVAGGYPVLTDPPRIVQPLDQVVDLGRSFVDNGTGLVEIAPARDVLDRRLSVAFIDSGVEAFWRRKGMWHWMRGRDRAFWLPSWADDLTLATGWGAAASYASVRPAGPSPAALIGRWVVIEDEVGQIYRQITAVTPVAGPLWRLTMAAPGRNVAASARVSLMVLARLDSDEIAMQYTLRAVLESGAVCVEVQG